ncbi:MAG: hypothetical protein V7676_04480 [Parasphingorhabdus sp.]|uniref:hypothetical protein n=1 Tax=Parasphingorhabdus sp. TaxID=2709688 RepID=UPI003001EF38
MIGPIIFMVLLGVMVVLPAFTGWKWSQKKEQFVRMGATILGGQAIATPVMGFIAFSAERAHDESPFKSVIIYASMALVISIMTFAILEIKKTHRGT